MPPKSREIMRFRGKTKSRLRGINARFALPVSPGMTPCRTIMRRLIIVIFGKFWLENGVQSEDTTNTGRNRGKRFERKRQSL
jgi:hypothetical protein